MSHRVIQGDCTLVLRDLAREGLLVDSVMADPPYHLASIVARLGQPDSAPIQSGVTGVYARSSQGFMGQQWDGGDVAFRPETWRRVFDVMKPGAHLVAFAATKGYHRMACAIEDAGFEIRDMIAWLYGTGFPKSHNLDGLWDGWGSALKPAIEPIVFAQKPISEASIAANVLRWGVGAINIDVSRVPIIDGENFDGGGQSRNGENVATHNEGWTRPWMRDSGAIAAHRERLVANVAKAREHGRWPANLCHDGSEEVLDAFAVYGERGAIAPVHERSADKFRNTYGAFAGNVDEQGSTFRGDTGTAARFFYSSKATQGERVFECRVCGAHVLGKLPCDHNDHRSHPTVKPVSLVRWLVEMVTPPCGLVLDPFAGTGTTGAAAEQAGMQSVLIEADANHVRDIAVRLGMPLQQLEAAKVDAFETSHGEQKDLFL